MAVDKKKTRMRDEFIEEDAPQFRTLGTKSARADLRRQQPKRASDLDGIGTPAPMSNPLPDEVELDVEDAQSARRQRNEKRSRIGALPEDQEEPQRIAAVRAARKKPAKREPAETPQAEVPSPEAPPVSYPDQTNRLFRGPSYVTNPQTGEREPSPQQRLFNDARSEFNRYRDLYGEMGASAHSQPDGTMMTLSEFVDDQAVRNPNGALSRAMATEVDGKPFLTTFNTGPAALENDLEAKRAATTTDLIRARAERQNMARTLMSSTEGPALIYQTISSAMDSQAQLLERTQAGEEITSGDLMQASMSANRAAAALTAAHAMFPGMGYDRMAAEHVLAAARYGDQAALLSGTKSQNVADVEMARAANSPQDAATIAENRSRQIAGLRQSPDRYGAARALAMAEKGTDAPDATIQAAANQNLFDAAILDAAEIVNSGQPLTADSAPMAALMPLAQSVTMDEFVNRVSPAIKADPQVARRVASLMYERLRPKRNLMRRTFSRAGGLLNDLLGEGYR